MGRLLSVVLLVCFGCSKARDLDVPVRAVVEALVIDVQVNTHDDVVVSDGFCSLREALLSAGGTTGLGCPTVSSGNTARVLLEAGDYAIAIAPTFNGQGRYVDENAGYGGDFDLPARGVEIVGLGSDQTRLLGAGLDRVLHAMGGMIGCSHVLRGISISGGCAHGGTCEALSAGNYPGDGGGFYDNSICFLDTTDDVLIEDNHGNHGGGLAVCATPTKPMAQLGAIVLRNNIAVAGGGLGAHVAVRCDGCTISDNTAGWGAGVSMYDGLLTLIDPTLEGNVATVGGAGALLARGQSNGTTSGEITVYGGTCTDNRATGNGGCAYAGERGTWEHCSSTKPCRVTLNGTVVSDNVADTAGGMPGSGGGVARGIGGLVELRGDAFVSVNSDLSSPVAPDCFGGIELYDQSVLGDTTGCAPIGDHRPPPCGDGIVSGSEQCDGGQCCTATCTFSAMGVSCSDGDQCTAGDACDGSGACVPGTGSGSTCGDFVTECGEQCDDGNAASNDGCSSACTTETCVAWE